MLGDGFVLDQLRPDVGGQRLGEADADPDRLPDRLAMEVDERELEISPELIECMQDEPEALNQFRSMPPSHQHYYSKWISSAKTEPTRARRIAMTIQAMVNGWDFGKMLREARKLK